MFRNIVWCGGVLAALLATLPPAEAGVPSAVADFVDAALAGFDWMTPILAPGMEMPALRSERFRFLMERYRCPSQMYTSITYYGSSGPDKSEFQAQGAIPGVSYLMPGAFQYFGRHAHAGVADRQHDIRPGPHLGPRCFIRFDRNIGGGQREPATLRHGVAGVDDQIEQGILELGLID